MFILVRQTICGAMLIRVGKLQFIGLIGGRILTWGRRVPASVLPCWGSRPQHGNALNRRAFACQGIEPWQANTDAGTRRPQVRTRSPKWPINCSLPTRINIDPNLQFIKPSLPTRCVMEPYTSIQYLFSFILWRKCVWEPIVGIFHLLVGYLNLLISAMLFFIIKPTFGCNKYNLYICPIIQ